MARSLAKSRCEGAAHGQTNARPDQFPVDATAGMLHRQTPPPPMTRKRGRCRADRVGPLAQGVVETRTDPLAGEVTHPIRLAATIGAPGKQLES